MPMMLSPTRRRMLFVPDMHSERMMTPGTRATSREKDLLVQRMVHISRQRH